MIKIDKIADMENNEDKIDAADEYRATRSPMNFHSRKCAANERCRRANRDANNKSRGVLYHGRV